MELEEAIELKVQLEYDIFEAVVKLCAEFYNKTGLVLTEVNINTQDVTSMGQPYPSKVFTSCTTSVDI